jgi:hypothetical protein
MLAPRGNGGGNGGSGGNVATTAAATAAAATAATAEGDGGDGPETAPTLAWKGVATEVGVRLPSHRDAEQLLALQDPARDADPGGLQRVHDL